FRFLRTVRFSIRKIDSDSSGLEVEFFRRARRLEPCHGPAFGNRERGRHLVRQPAETGTRVLRLPFVYLGGRDRSVFIARSVFLLRLPRTGPAPDVSPYWNLGKRRPDRGRLENHHLFGHGQFHSVVRPDFSPSKPARGAAHF